MEMMVWAVAGMTLFRSLSMKIGFKQASLYLTARLSLLPAVAPGKIPEIINEILDMAESFILPGRRVRHYPGAVKKKPQRYALRQPLKA
jgi:hypothetical protein